MDLLFGGICLVIALLFPVVFIRYTVYIYRQIPSLNGFTGREKAILTRQVVAFMLDFLLMAWYVMSMSFASLAGLTLTLGYISLTSIFCRISIFQPGRRYISSQWWIPSRGANAIFEGILIFIALLIPIGMKFFQCSMSRTACF